MAMIDEVYAGSTNDVRIDINHMCPAGLPLPVSKAMYYSLGTCTITTTTHGRDII